MVRKTYIINIFKNHNLNKCIIKDKKKKKKMRVSMHSEFTCIHILHTRRCYSINSNEYTNTNIDCVYFAIILWSDVPVVVYVCDEPAIMIKLSAVCVRR